MSDECSGIDYDGDLGIRISSIFVILVGSLWGAAFPTFARRNPSTMVPEWAFFIAKFFGSGVIIATAFIHLLSPANDALRSDCLSGPITEYDWVSGIVLMVIFVMFFVEFLTMRYAKFGESHEHELQDAPDPAARILRRAMSADLRKGSVVSTRNRNSISMPGQPGEEHLGHAKDHQANEEMPPLTWEEKGMIPETYAAQLTAIFILEFGVIFHSVFVGLTLAVASIEQFKILYVVLVFHQTFEGLGLGSRLASVPWPVKRRWTPYFLALAYGLTTPISIAAGLGVRFTFQQNASTTLLVNGIFDSISAGILIYTGLVELMAHEFMFSTEMQKAPIRVVLAAFFTMCVGAGLMALLGKWA